jgi:anthranilate 1,2-dioxygenase small subunit
MDLDLQLQLTVERLLSDYVHCIDDDRLEQWPAFFTDPCLYKITSADNHERGLPIGLFFANTRGMLSDRVSALREASVYEPQRYRHLVSSIRIMARDGATVRVQSNFLVVRIMRDGTTSLFASGRYLDRISLAGPEPLLAEKIVVCDSGRIDTLLALPL